MKLQLAQTKNKYQKSYRRGGKGECQFSASKW